MYPDMNVNEGLLLFPSLLSDSLKLGSILIDKDEFEALVFSVDPGHKKVFAVSARTRKGRWYEFNELRHCLVYTEARTQLAQWVAASLNLKPSSLQPVFQCLGSHPVWGGSTWSLTTDHSIGSRLSDGSGDPWLGFATFESVATGQDANVSLRIHVPALASLDPNDPRLLHDGSRLVDALALSAVAQWLQDRGGK